VYSQHNLDRNRRIAELLQDGLNLTRIALVTDRSRSWHTPGLASDQNALQVSASAHLLLRRR